MENRYREQRRIDIEIRMFWIQLSCWIFFRALLKGKNQIFGTVSSCWTAWECGMVVSGCGLWSAISRFKEHFSDIITILFRLHAVSSRLNLRIFIHAYDQLGQFSGHSGHEMAFRFMKRIHNPTRPPTLVIVFFAQYSLVTGKEKEKHGRFNNTEH